MKKMRHLAAVLLAASAALMLSACWDRVELDQVAIVMGLGVDAVSQASLKVTAQIALPAKKSSDTSGAEGQGEKASASVCTGTGKTVADAITRGLYKDSPRRVYLAHTAVVVLGEGEAKAGISGVTDYLLRRQELRENTWILVGKPDAEEVLRMKMEGAAVPARSLAFMLENEVRVGNSRGTQLHIFAEALSDKTRAATAAVIEVENEAGKPRLTISNTAVFKGDKMIGELDQKVTRGLMWVLGEVKGGSITVRSQCGTDCSIAVQASYSRVTGRMQDGRPQVHIQVNVDGVLDSVTCPDDLTKPGVLEFLNDQQKRLVEQEISEALSEARRMNADIFGFGQAVHAGYRGDWKPLEENWDSLFRETSVEVEVTTTLRHLSLLTRSAVPQ